MPASESPAESKVALIVASSLASVGVSRCTRLLRMRDHASCGGRESLTPNNHHAFAADELTDRTCVTRRLGEGAR